MSNTINPAKIHVGRGDIWVGGTTPVPAATLNALTSGAPIYGGTNYLGSTMGAANIKIKSDYTEIEVEQAYTPVDVALKAEAIEVEVMLGELAAANLKAFLQQASLTTNTVTTPKTGLITVGGLNTVTPFVMAIASPKRDGTGNYYIFTLYRAFGCSGLDIPLERKKETTFKVTFKGLADATRAVGDQLYQIVEQY